MSDQLEPDITMNIATLVGAAGLFGHALEDRRRIAHRQEPDLVDRVVIGSATLLSPAARKVPFLAAPMDILPYRMADGRRACQLLELNGSGMAGMLNMPYRVVSMILGYMEQFAQSIANKDPLILVSFSGDPKEGKENKMIHEKMLYADALVRGFFKAGKLAEVLALPDLEQGVALPESGPTIVLGFTRQILKKLKVVDGKVTLKGRVVNVAVNDRLTRSMAKRYGHHNLVAQGLLSLNASYDAGADKHVAYGHLNDFLAKQKKGSVCQPVDFEMAKEGKELRAAVLRRLREGKATVIKPQGTGHGDGIDFIFPDYSEFDAVAAVERSIATIKAKYSLRNSGFPYTVCSYIDALTVDRPNHHLHNHKYELRVIAFRDGNTIKACPSIAKMAGMPWNPGEIRREMLINNLNADYRDQGHRLDYVLPLLNRETLDILGYEIQDLIDLCQFATGFVCHLMDELAAGEVAPAPLPKAARG